MAQLLLKELRIIVNEFRSLLLVILIWLVMQQDKVFPMTQNAKSRTGLALVIEKVRYVFQIFIYH